MPTQLTPVQLTELASKIETKHTSLSLDEACQALEALIDGTYPGASDMEEDHIIADSILCRLLEAHGCDRAVHLFKKLPKWYS